MHEAFHKQRLFSYVNAICSPYDIQLKIDGNARFIELQTFLNRSKRNMEMSDVQMSLHQYPFFEDPLSQLATECFWFLSFRRRSKKKSHQLALARHTQNVQII